MNPDLIVSGAFVLIIALGLLLFARGAKRAVARLSDVPTVTTSQVGELANTNSVCEVVGTAQSAPGGTLTSTVTNTACVWHRVVIYEEYEERDDQGGSSSKSRILNDIPSPQAFWLEDTSGRVVIVPTGAVVDSAQKSYDQYTHDLGPLAENNKQLAWLQNSPDARRFHVIETFIPAGASLFVSGQAMNTPHGPAVGELPTRNKFLISLRSEEQVSAGKKRQLLVFSILAGVAGLLGLALIVSGVA